MKHDLESYLRGFLTAGIVIVNLAFIEIEALSGPVDVLLVVITSEAVMGDSESELGVYIVITTGNSQVVGLDEST